MNFSFAPMVGNLRTAILIFGFHHTDHMKAFLQHENGSFYQEDGWVDSVAEARSFSSEADAEVFRLARQVDAARTVQRIDPTLIARFQTRAPGRYQAGE